MNANNSAMKTLLKKIAVSLASSGDDEWPPRCTALLYQPVHPTLATTSTDSKCLPKSK